MSVRTLAHAKIWKQQGHDVYVVTCAPNFPRGTIFEGYKNKIYQEEILDGIHIIRLWSYMAPNEGFIKRIFDYASFFISSILLSTRFPRFDILIATSPPIFVAIAGYSIAKLKNRPWVFELRDLWPASIKAVGASRSTALGLVEKLELFLYRKADLIIALTNSFKEDLCRRGINAQKIDIITNGVDSEQFHTGNNRVEIRKRLGVTQSDFLVGYVGTTGMAHGLTTMVDAAKLCTTDPQLKFLIIGEGAERRYLENYSNSLALENLQFKDFVPHEDIPAYLDALDASIVHLKRDPLFKTVIPSKIFECMAMGLPIILGVEGESAEIVQAANCGLCIQPEEPGAMADAVRRLHLNGNLRRSLGEMRHGSR